MSEHHTPVNGQHINDRMLVKTGGVWASAIGLATLIVVAFGLMRAFQLALSNGNPQVQPVEVQEQLSLINRMAPLSANQRAERGVYEREQNELLSTYGWVDEKQQLVRIPIDRAMSIIVQQYGKAE